MKKALVLTALFTVFATFTTLFSQNADTTRITKLEEGVEFSEEFAGRTVTGDISISRVDNKKMIVIDYTITGNGDKEFYGVETDVKVDGNNAGTGFVGSKAGYAGDLFQISDTAKTATIVVEFHYSRMRCMCPSNEADRVFIITLSDLSSLTPDAVMPAFDSIYVNMLDNAREEYAAEWDSLQIAYKKKYRWSAEVQIRYSYDVQTDIMTIRIPGGTFAMIGSSSSPEMDDDVLTLQPYYRRYKANGRKWVGLNESAFEYKGELIGGFSRVVELK